MLHHNYAHVRPQSGDVIFFYHLHLNQAELAPDVQLPGEEETVTFRVKGKARPMLIVSETDKGGEVRWYLALQLTATNRTKNGNLKPRLLPLGCLYGKKESYADCVPLHYPDNLLCGEVKTTIDPLKLSGILEQITTTLLGRP